MFSVLQRNAALDKEPLHKYIYEIKEFFFFYFFRRGSGTQNTLKNQ